MNLKRRDIRKWVASGLTRPSRRFDAVLWLWGRGLWLTWVAILWIVNAAAALQLIFTALVIGIIVYALARGR